MSVSDQELVQRLQQGDRLAFAQVIERHQRSVYGYLRARLSQSSDAEDLAQEVFLRFWLARARFDSEALIRPWLLGIARNLLRERIRSVKRRKEGGWTELCLELETVLGPDWGDEDDLLLFLPDCLDQLGPSARQAVEMKYRAEKRLTEIGAELHRSEGAVKLLVHRARQALRNCLDGKRKRQNHAE